MNISVMEYLNEEELAAAVLQRKHSVTGQAGLLIYSHNTIKRSHTAKKVCMELCAPRSDHQ